MENIIEQAILIFSGIGFYLAQFFTFSSAVFLIGKMFFQWLLKQVARQISETIAMQQVEGKVFDYILLYASISGHKLDIETLNSKRNDLKKEGMPDSHHAMLTKIIDGSKRCDTSDSATALAKLFTDNTESKEAIPLPPSPSKPIGITLYRRNQITYKTVIDNEDSAISDFYNLYNQINRQDPRMIGLPSGIYESPKFDAFAHRLFVAYDGRKAIGGLMLSIADKSSRLPTEIDLKKRIYELDPNLPLNDCRYCEIHKMVLLPEYRGNTYNTSSLFEMALNEAVKQRCRFVFLLADKVRMRMYNQLFSRNGANPMHLKVIDASLPDHSSFEGIKMGVGYIDLSNYITE